MTRFVLSPYVNRICQKLVDEVYIWYSLVSPGTGLNIIVSLIMPPPRVAERLCFQIIHVSFHLLFHFR